MPIQVFSQAQGILKWVGLLEMEGGRGDNSDIKVQCWPEQALIKVAPGTVDSSTGTALYTPGTSVKHRHRTADLEVVSNFISSCEFKCTSAG